MAKNEQCVACGAERLSTDMAHYWAPDEDRIALCHPFDAEGDTCYMLHMDKLVGW